MLMTSDQTIADRTMPVTSDQYNNLAAALVPFLAANRAPVGIRSVLSPADPASVASLAEQVARVTADNAALVAHVQALVGTVERQSSQIEELVARAQMADAITSGLVEKDRKKQADILALASKVQKLALSSTKQASRIQELEVRIATVAERRLKSIPIKSPAEPIIQADQKAQILPNAKATPFEIVIKRKYGAALPLLVKSDDSIHSVKVLIRSRLQVPVEEQSLQFDGQLLGNDRTINDCKIAAKASLLFSRKVSAPCKVEVNPPPDIRWDKAGFKVLPVSLMFDCSDELEAVKSEIQNVWSFEPSKQRLFHDGQYLTGNYKLYVYGIKSGATIACELAQEMSIKRGSGGSDVKIRVHKVDRIDVIKKAIERACGIGAKDQLLHDETGRLLTDNGTLGGYSLDVHSIITLTTVAKSE